MRSSDFTRSDRLSDQIRTEISTILRDYLKVCDNNREAKIILHAGQVLIDQRVVRKPKTAVGLMDVISLPKMKKHFRTMIDNHGRLEFVQIKQTVAI